MKLVFSFPIHPAYKILKLILSLPFTLVILQVAAEEGVIELEELVVTAQKREQVIQEVPIAVTAYNNEFLNNVGVDELSELAAFVPGLEIQEQSPNNPGFVIRGITSDSGEANIEPRVSIFQDGVSISRSRGSVVELFDIERVEVLKGPQGTLFGRAAEIGAVSIIQNKAVDDTLGEVRFGYGNFDQLLISGFYNTPIIEEKVFGRIAAIYKNRDGYLDNIAGGDLNGTETFAFRSLLLFIPNDRTVIDLIFNFQSDTSSGTAFKNKIYAPTGGDTSPFSAAELNRGTNLFIDRDVWGITGITDIQFNDAWSLSLITGYRTFEALEEFDADGSQAFALEFAEDAEGDQFSQEVRFNFDKGGRLTGFTGFSYFYEEGSQRVPFRTDERSLYPLLTPLLNSVGVPVPLEPLILPNGSPNLVTNLPPIPQIFGPLAGAPLKDFHEESFANYGETSAFDVFIDGTYTLTEKFELIAGLRGTYEDVTAAYEVTNSVTPGTLGPLLPGSPVPNNIFSPTNGRVTGSDEFTSLVGRVIARYQFNENTNIFASVSRGRRPNVIEVDESGPISLSDEIVWSYELGIKGVVMDGRLFYDASIFTYDYENFQTNIINDQLQVDTIDAGNASANGAELSINSLITEGVNIFGNYSWLDANFDETDSNGNPQIFSGNRFRLTSKHSFALGANFVTPAGKWGDFFVTPTYTWKSHQFFEEDNDALGFGVEQGDYGLFNIRFGLRLPGDRWEISGYVKNILDEDYLIDAGNTGANFGLPTFISGPPQFIGLQITGRF